MNYELRENIFNLHIYSFMAFGTWKMATNLI